MSVYALNYGNNGTGDIPTSAHQLQTFVESFVLPNSGASKVDIVGHSQGGMMPRYYIRYLGGAGKVDDLVGLAPSNHGTSNPMTLFPGLGYWCAACLQQRTGSDFLTRLNSGDETPGPVSYTTIVTRHDGVVTPYTSGYLAGAVNITIQEYSVVHDDQGAVVRLPESPARAKASPRRLEWHELAPVRVTINAPDVQSERNRSRGRLA